MLKKAINLLSHIAPTLVTKLAYTKLSNPQVSKLRPHEIEVLDKSEKAIFQFRGFDIQSYRWGNGQTRILLIHGWEGQAGNFADIVERLLKEDYTVFAFDAPSHGFSSKGKTNLFDFTDLVGVLIEKYDVTKLLSHSFGGVATTYALTKLPDLTIEKYLLLTTPNRFRERIDEVAAQVGITDKVKFRLIDRLNTEVKGDIEVLNVADFVKNINVKKALIIHDKNDKIIPISISRTVNENWDNCSLLEVEGTGHFRVLRTPDVIDQVIAFLD